MSLRYTAVSLISGRLQHQQLAQTTIPVDHILIFLFTCQRSKAEKDELWVEWTSRETMHQWAGWAGRSPSLRPPALDSGTHLFTSRLQIILLSLPAFPCGHVGRQGAPRKEAFIAKCELISLLKIKINKFVHLLFLLFWNFWNSRT